MMGYYDLVLGLIPATLFGLTGALYGIGLAMSYAVPIAGIAAATIIGHAMFVNGPVASRDRAKAAPSASTSQPSE